MSLSHNEVAHRWAHKRAGNGTHLFSDGEILKSYATPIACHFGTGTVLLSTHRYSASTSKHQSHVRSASSHLTQYFVSEVPWHAITRDWALEEIEKQVLEAEKLRATAARAPKYGVYKLQDAQCCHDTAMFLAKEFKIRKNIDKLAESLAKEAANAEKRAKKLLKQQAESFALLVAKWKTNEPGVTLGVHYNRKTYLRRNGDTIETSKGITIPYPAFERYVRRYQEHGEIPKTVAGYPMSSVNSDHVVIGCHDLSWEEINSCLKG